MPAGALYARYVPPKPANKAVKSEVKSEVLVETVRKSPVDTWSDSPSHKRKRDDKSEQKAKRKSSSHVVAEKGIVTTEETNATSEVVESESRAQAPSDATIATAGDSKPSKPPKRIKRQKTNVAKESGAGENADASEDDGTTKRHARVFAKFQKSLNASGDAAEQDSDTEMLDDAEQPTLHGKSDCSYFVRISAHVN
jgi:hypothetical protein